MHAGRRRYGCVNVSQHRRVQRVLAKLIRSRKSTLGDCLRRWNESMQIAGREEVRRGDFQERTLLQINRGERRNNATLSDHQTGKTITDVNEKRQHTVCENTVRTALAHFSSALVWLPTATLVSAARTRLSSSIASRRRRRLTASLPPLAAPAPAAAPAVPSVGFCLRRRSAMRSAIRFSSMSPLHLTSAVSARGLQCSGIFKNSGTKSIEITRKKYQVKLEDAEVKQTFPGCRRGNATRG